MYRWQNPERKLWQTLGLCEVRGMRVAEGCVPVAVERSSPWRGRARAVSTDAASQCDLGAVPHGGGPGHLLGAGPLADAGASAGARAKRGCEIYGASKL